MINNGKVVRYWDMDKSKPQYEDSYLNDKLHGVSKSWRSDGSLKWECPYVNGICEGIETAWYQNGTRNDLLTWKKYSLHGANIVFVYHR